MWAQVKLKRSVWASWVAPASGYVEMSTAGSGFDTWLAAFTMTDSSLVPVSYDDDSGEYHTSYVAFNVEGGREYVIGLASETKGTGDFVFTWSFTAGRSVPTVWTSPFGRTVGLGDPVTLSVNASAAGPITYQWYKNGELIAGANSAYLDFPTGVQATDVGIYNCHVTADGFTVTSKDIELQINTERQNAVAMNKRTMVDHFGIVAKVPDLTLPNSGSAKGGKKGTVSATSTRLRALDISGSAGYSGTQIFQTYWGKDASEPNHCGIVGGASYWMAYTAPQDGMVSIDTDGSSYDTILAVYTDSGAYAGYSSLNRVNCDNNSGSNGLTSRTVFYVTANQTYYIVVDGVYGAHGLVYFHYSLNTRPLMSAVPNVSTQQDTASTPASFTVADRETPASSLWLFAWPSNPSLIPWGNITFGGSGNDRTVSVRPAPGVSGTTTITIYAIDGGWMYAVSTFTVTVVGGNHIPVANLDYSSRAGNSFMYIYLPRILSNDTDADGDRLSFYTSWASTSAGGRISRSGDYLIYTAPAGFYGTDSFYYVISDGRGGYGGNWIYIAP